ncbi:GNAT family N-acetyltransferase [Microbulbifer sp. HZ11]|nr:GNAT family N-acetyltransferase [Microbulbifer sp. HZ11]
MSKGKRNATVPYLQEGERVVLFDGVCRLCSFWARFLLKFDRHRRLKLATVQSEEGQAILSFFAMPLDEYETLLLVESGQMYVKSDAILRILKLLPFPWPALSCFRLIPPSVRDWIYDRVARNRYRLFGKQLECALPRAEDRARFISKKKSPEMEIRKALPTDFEQIWPIFFQVVSAGDTYAYAPDTSRDQAYKIWMDVPRKTYVCEEAGEILGTYYLKTNQAGPGSHVCNCGYMVAASARGRGLASAMCEHSQDVARELGYRAMQFNFVASTNQGAVRLWKKLGFDEVGRLPGAFNHPTAGFVDALVMYKTLVD